jgi:agmatine deiminase
MERWTVLATEETLLDPNHNPHMSKAQIEKILLQQLGASKMIWTH